MHKEDGPFEGPLEAERLRFMLELFDKPKPELEKPPSETADNVISFPKQRCVD